MFKFVDENFVAVERAGVFEGGLKVQPFKFGGYRFGNAVAVETLTTTHAQQSIVVVGTDVEKEAVDGRIGLHVEAENNLLIFFGQFQNSGISQRVSYGARTRRTCQFAGNLLNLFAAFFVADDVMNFFSSRCLRNFRV